MICQLSGGNGIRTRKLGICDHRIVSYVSTVACPCNFSSEAVVVDSNHLALSRM